MAASPLLLDSALYRPDAGLYALYTGDIIPFSGVRLFSTSDPSQFITLAYPVRPYTSRYKLSIDVEKADDNTYLFYDNGIAYDTVSCECSFVISYAQAVLLDTFLRAYRTENYVLDMGGSIASGFYPFFPHRGNVGPFTIACDILKFAGFQGSPYKYFKIDLRFTAVYENTWPSFSLPAEVAEGDLTIDGVTGIRYPEANFEPGVDFPRFLITDEKTEAYYDTHGASADQVTTSMKLRLNTGKAAALFNQLLVTRRTGAFNLVVGANQYPFGEHYGDNRTFSCKLLQDTVELTHQENNLFETELKLWRVSG